MFYKIRYKAWKHLNKKMKRIISIGKTALFSYKQYKIWKHLSKKLIKKRIIADHTPLLQSSDRLLKKIESLFTDLKNAVLSADALVKEKELRNFADYDYRRLFYQQSINFLKIKRKSGDKIRVCFAIISETSFSLRSVFEKMMRDDFLIPLSPLSPTRQKGLNINPNCSMRQRNFV